MDGGAGLYRAYRISPLCDRIARVLSTCQGRFLHLCFYGPGDLGCPRVAFLGSKRSASVNMERTFVVSVVNF